MEPQNEKTFGRSVKQTAETAFLAYIAVKVVHGFAAMARDLASFFRVRRANKLSPES